MSAMSNAAATPARRARHSGTGRLRLIERLHEVVASINSGQDIDVVLEKICATAAELVDADLGVFLRIDRGRWRPTVVRRGETGQVFDNVVHTVVQEDDWVAQLVREGSGWCAFPVDDVSPVVADVVGLALPEARTGMVAAARASAQSGGALVVVYGDNKRTPEPAEIDVLVLLAEQAGVALSSAKSSAEMARGLQYQHVIIDATADGLAVLDGDGRVTQWNRSASSLTGLSGDAVVGKPPPFPVSDPGQVLDHRLPNGRWVEITCSAVPGSDDLVLEFRDVSQAKELEQAKDTFLSTAAHELRTPVTAIHGFSTTLLRRWEDLSDAGRRAAVEVVADRSAALASTVDKVVLGTTVSAEDPELIAEPVDLATTLGEILADYTPSSDQHRIIFDVSESGSLAWCDRRTLPEIVNQLLENAVKFSPNGGDVVIRVWDEEDYVGFSVRDQGVGVDAEELNQMFDLFYQGGAGDRRQFGGLGLGLYIVRQLVRAQNGSVAARQTDGRGIEISIHLPRWAQSTPARYVS